jgi:hypothetical protein
MERAMTERYPKSGARTGTDLQYLQPRRASIDACDRPSAIFDLNLSQNAQFQDTPGACKLIGTAVERGDQTMGAAPGRSAAPTEQTACRRQSLFGAD